MSRQPLGKTLLRNVIRHTDAHNKIQEEMEMWKMREWEIHKSQHKHLSAAASMRGHVHCVQVSDQSKQIGLSRERVSEHDDRDAKYWTRQLYEFEDKDPDRWGHSGFKELYPEEFSSGSDTSNSKRMANHKCKKSKSGKEASISKHSKKSSRKKKKKKKKKEGGGKRKKAESWNSDSETDDSAAAKDGQRQQKRTKTKHKKTVKKGRDSDSSSADSDSEKDTERRICRNKKRKQDSHKASDSVPDSKKKKRKDWRAAGEESSDGSSGD